MKDNGQPGVSALIVAGGWIEGLYIATQIATTTNNEKITTRIAEQKLSLDNVIELLNAYKNDNAGIIETLVQLEGLKKAFDKIAVPASETTATTDKEKGVTTVGSNSAITITPEQLKEISAAAAQVRNKIIQ